MIVPMPRKLKTIKFLHKFFADGCLDCNDRIKYRSTPFTGETLCKTVQDGAQILAISDSDIFKLKKVVLSYSSSTFLPLACSSLKTSKHLPWDFIVPFFTLVLSIRRKLCQSLPSIYRLPTEPVLKGISQEILQRVFYEQ